MAHGPRHHAPMRRRREGKTDYRRRLALLKSHKPRVVVRRKLRNVIVQMVAYSPEGDRIVASAQARDLTKLGWQSSLKNTPAAYLTGLLAGKRAAQKGVREGVLDLGRQLPAPGGRLFAALQGVLDAGIQVPHGKDTLPDGDRLKGVHIDEGLAATFEAVRSKIQGGA